MNSQEKEKPEKTRLLKLGALQHNFREVSQLLSNATSLQYEADWGDTGTPCCV